MSVGFLTGFSNFIKQNPIVTVSLQLSMEHATLVKHDCGCHLTFNVSFSLNPAPSSDVSAWRVAYFVVCPAVASALASVVSSDHSIVSANQRAQSLTNLCVVWIFRA